MMASLGLVVGGWWVVGGLAVAQLTVSNPCACASVAGGMVWLAAVSGEGAKEVGRRRAASPQSQVRRGSGRACGGSRRGRDGAGSD